MYKQRIFLKRISDSFLLVLGLDKAKAKLLKLSLIIAIREFQYIVSKIRITRNKSPSKTSPQVYDIVTTLNKRDCTTKGNNKIITTM